MKIEIDLSDILGDEYGNAETLAGCVYRQVTDAIVKCLEDETKKAVREKVATVIDSQITTEMARILPGILDNLIDAEYTPTSHWGDRSKPTTIRKTVVSLLESELQMTRKDAYGSSSPTAVKKAIDAIIAEHLAAFKKTFDSQVQADLNAKAMAYAVESLQKRLGIKI